MQVQQRQAAAASSSSSSSSDRSSRRCHGGVGIANIFVRRTFSLLTFFVLLPDVGASASATPIVAAVFNQQ